MSNIDFYMCKTENLTSAKLKENDAAYLILETTSETDSLTGNMFLLSKEESDALISVVDFLAMNKELKDLYTHLCENWLKREGISLTQEKENDLI